MKGFSLFAGLALVLGWSAAGWAGDCDFAIRLSDAKGREGAQVKIGVTLDFDVAQDGGAGIQGWSYGICHDPEVVTPISAVASDELLTIKNGQPPSFSNINLEPDEPTPGVANGVTHGVVLDFLATFSIEPPINNLPDLTITYQLDHGPACPADPTETPPACVETSIQPCNDLGSPKIVSVMVIGGKSFPYCAEASRVGTLRICCPPPELAFVRGDANIDRRVDIADGITVLNWLFHSAEAPRCMEAADVNNDGEVDSSDAIYIFHWQFMDGLTPASPWPDCGLDPATPVDDLTCEEYPCG
ncbi:MAG: dockerin type I repeat-containing protein [Planctomycetes bacterium]|nr:dockerin type I repeat-containing protein [Planctomycetota bacterium]